MFKAKIGADPEFLISLNGMFMPAREYLDNHEISEEGITIPEGNIGCDGASDTGEIRPKEEYCPKKLTKNIKKLIEKYKKISEQNIELNTISVNRPIGGHVHLEAKSLHGTSNRVKYLKLTPYLIPIILSENKINIQRRLNHSYGRLDDYRLERKGTSQTVEVRTLTAEWITSEKIAYCTLAYLYTVWHEILNHPKSFLNSKTRITKLSTLNGIQKLIIDNYKLIINETLKEIKQKIVKFELYEKYKKEINFILNIKKVIQEKEKYNYDAIKGWKIGTNTKTKIITNYEQNLSKFENYIRTNQKIMKKIDNKTIILFGLKNEMKNFLILKNNNFINNNKELKRKEHYEFYKSICNNLINRYRETQFDKDKNTMIKQKGKENSEVIVIGIPMNIRTNQLLLNHEANKFAININKALKEKVNYINYTDLK